VIAEPVLVQHIKEKWPRDRVEGTREIKLQKDMGCAELVK
jgi:hypothetical protein